MNLSQVKFDCRHFRGGIPCKPNKISGKICSSCDVYDKVNTRILIIKLGALGDVIRTTPLVTRFRTEFPGCHITWITLSPGILPKYKIDEILPFNFVSIYNLQHRQFDIALNLDKETEACALLADVKAANKFGFIWANNQIAIANADAEHKLITGLFDNISKENKKNYLEEIFEICGYKFNNEEYLLDVDPVFFEKWRSLRMLANGKQIVGLNTGCGKRWLTRLWPESHWINLINDLKKSGYFPLLLGGKDEDEQNKKYAKQTGAHYPGTYSLEEFIAISAHCDTIVTAVSMMMHIATGLQKPLVLFNNIFNRNEFYLYERGKIVEPPSSCDCYYGNTCTRSNHCMNDLSHETVLNAVKDLTPVKA